jgi:hypothetical protein
MFYLLQDFRLYHIWLLELYNEPIPASTYEKIKSMDVLARYTTQVTKCDIGENLAINKTCFKLSNDDK